MSQKHQLGVHHLGWGSMLTYDLLSNFVTSPNVLNPEQTFELKQVYLYQHTSQIFYKDYSKKLNNVVYVTKEVLHALVHILYVVSQILFLQSLITI